MALVQAQLARQRSLAASSALNLPDGGRRLALRIQQLESELASLTAPHAHPSAYTPAGSIDPMHAGRMDLAGPVTPIIDITAAPLPATVLHPPRHNAVPQRNMRSKAHCIQQQKQHSPSDAIDLTTNTPCPSSSMDPRPTQAALDPAQAIDLDAADSMPESRAKPGQTADINALTDKLQQQLTIKPAVHLPRSQALHSMIDTAHDTGQSSGIAPAFLLHSGPKELTAASVPVESAVAAGRPLTADQQRTGTHAASHDHKHRAARRTSEQPIPSSASQPPQFNQCRHEHTGTFPPDGCATWHGADGPKQAQRPLVSITNVMPPGAQSKKVAGKEPSNLQKPAAPQAVPAAPQHATSMAHATDGQQSGSGGSQAQSQPEHKCDEAANAHQGVEAGNHAGTKAAAGRAELEAELALLKQKLHKYCAILASEPHRRELPDGGLRVGPSAPLHTGAASVKDAQSYTCTRRCMAIVDATDVST